MPISLLDLSSEKPTEIGLESFSFPGGERHVRIKARTELKAVRIVAHITSSDDIMSLLLLSDAVDRLGDKYLHKELLIPYLPYARQDRVAVLGESLSVSVFTKLLESMNFSSIVVWDVHSTVSQALMPKCTRFIEQYELVNWVIPKLKDYDFVVAPDVGATKKIEKLGLPVIQAYKERDPKTGTLSKCRIDINSSLGGLRVLVVDDICDGGGTFVQLAKELIDFDADPENMHLYITHGIFSKGIGPVFKGLYDRVYCPNVLNPAAAEHFTSKCFQL